MNNIVSQTKNKFSKGTKTTLKLIIIFILMVILLVPQSLIRDLVQERSNRQMNLTASISNQIGDEQDVTGPILCIPYLEEIVTMKGKIKEIKYENRFAFFTAKELLINSNAQVENKTKGIYKIPKFESINTIKGRFSVPDFSKWEIKPKLIQYDKAFILMKISDLKGINKTPKITYLNETIEFNPMTTTQNKTIFGDIKAGLPENWQEQETSFTIHLELRGTKAINFASTAKTNKMTMTSNWLHPNFESTVKLSRSGKYAVHNRHRANTLPNEREITDTGFTANWEESQFSIEQPTQWLSSEGSPNLKSRLMGVQFVNVADQYAKTERSAKYMLLVVSLVFLTFFIIEMLKSVSVHPFQYVLVGLAIAVFFVLLIALSEYMKFDLSYLVAAISTTVLISLYSLSVFKHKGMASSIGILLIALFAFIFVILTAADYSLLLGAIGLFLILAIVMYATRNIQWTQDS